MCQVKQIRRALISVYHKEPSRRFIETLHSLGVIMISTGGTLDFIRSLGMQAIDVGQITGFSEMLSGRVKTLHPAIFGGILARRHLPEDLLQLKHHGVEPIDLVVVDLYPFADTVAQSCNDEVILEKIDIGGISLIRAAAKNFRDVMVVPAQQYFDEAIALLLEQNANSTIEQRKKFAAAAFRVSSSYDDAIDSYLQEAGAQGKFRLEFSEYTPLRYGENPHQAGGFYGNLRNFITQIHGKELSYNNLVDVEAALGLVAEFSEPAFAVIKHNNACGFGVDLHIYNAMEKALNGDPLSIFGGILVCNRAVTVEMANRLKEMFFEVLIAPEFLQDSLPIFMGKKNRILLINKQVYRPQSVFRQLFDGVLQQTADIVDNNPDNWQFVTFAKANQSQIADLVTANCIAKHLKSNAIAVVKDGMLLGAGTGQTSRIDAVRISLSKPLHFGHELNGAVLASDAFFPFADWVDEAQRVGISAVVQPGGSVRDAESIEKCDQAGIAMAFTGLRHFRH